MNILKSGVSFLFLICATLHINAQSTTADNIAKSVFEKEGFPGMAIEVWKSGEEVFSKAYGYADIEKAIPIDHKTTLFRIGSVSKPFTAAGLALLYEDGKVDLDAPIQNYVPSFPQKEHKITLRLLAGHLGGIRHYRGFEFMNNIHYPSVTEGLSIFAHDDLINVPGSKYSYSSYGWNLISAAMETISEEEFLSFMNHRVFKVIGMKHTVPDDNTLDLENKATFYSKDSQGKPTVAARVDNSYKWAGGGFLSTVHDMAIFAQAHLDASFLKKETIDLWTTSQVTTGGDKTNYGIGWRSGEDKKGRQWYGHSGGSVGGSTMLLIFPKEELIVALTINLGQAQYGNLAFRIAEQFLN